MLDLNIAHLEYDSAMQALTQSIPDINNIAINIDFGADHTQSKIIRDFVGHIFDMHGIIAPWRGRFILITDELINNAIEHGSISWDLDTCIIEATRDTDGLFSINLEVHDTGKGKDAEKGKDMIAVKISHSEKAKDGISMEKRGRWLFTITEKLVDKLSFSESPKWGLAVRIEKNIEACEYGNPAK